MNYRIKENRSNPDIVILQRKAPERIILGTLLLTTGIIAGITALALFLPDQEQGWLTSLGIAFAATATALGFLLLRGIPYSIVFDNKNRSVAILEKKSSRIEERFILPYSQFDHFAIHNHYFSSSGHGRSSRPAVELIRKDGSSWVIYSSMFKSRSKRYCDRLQKLIHLNKSGETEPVPDDKTSDDRIDLTDVDNSILYGNRFLVQQYATSTSISWQESIQPGEKLLALFFVAGAIITAWDNRWQMPLQVMIGITIFLGAFLVVVLYQMATIFFLNHYIRIDSEKLVYHRPGLPPYGKTREVALARINEIVFLFSIFKNERALYIFKADQQQQLMQLKRGDITVGDAFSAITLIKDMFTITSPGISTSDLALLEQLLESLLNRK